MELNQSLQIPSTPRSAVEAGGWSTMEHQSHAQWGKGGPWWDCGPQEGGVAEEQNAPQWHPQQEQWMERGVQEPKEWASNYQQYEQNSCTTTPTIIKGTVTSHNRGSQPIEPESNTERPMEQTYMGEPRCDQEQTRTATLEQAGWGNNRSLGNKPQVMTQAQYQGWETDFLRGNRQNWIMQEREPDVVVTGSLQYYTETG